jgi:hypothetical protein
MTQLDLKIPKYAREMLWLTAGEQFTTNQFEQDLNISETPILLRWGNPQGAVMARWAAIADKLSWQGQVEVRGTVEAVHLLTVKNLDLMVIEIVGNVPLTPIARFPNLADLREQPFERSPFRETDMPPSWYAFLLPLDSPLGDFAHHSLTHGGSIDAYGTLADEKSGFHTFLGMPLVMESLTLFP